MLVTAFQRASRPILALCFFGTLTQQVVLTLLYLPWPDLLIPPPSTPCLFTHSLCMCVYLLRCLSLAVTVSVSLFFSPSLSVSLSFCLSHPPPPLSLSLRQAKHKQKGEVEWCTSRTGFPPGAGDPRDKAISIVKGVAKCQSSIAGTPSLPLRGLDLLS